MKEGTFIAAGLPVLMLGGLLLAGGDWRALRESNAKVIAEPLPPEVKEDAEVLPPKKETAPALVRPVTEKTDWWAGKEELMRKIERDRYFSYDPPVDSFGSEEERIEARREFVFEEFEKWLKRYRREKDAVQRALLIPEGVVRAKIRQRELETLQISDPGVALEYGIASELREAMPEEVRAIVMESAGEPVRGN